MPDTSQNFKNHARWDPAVHFVLFPIFFFNLCFSVYKLWQYVSFITIWQTVLAVAFIIWLGRMRVYSLRVQDR